jgi:soluble epoxide hydrolase/lipid-phosphate phosphatase
VGPPPAGITKTVVKILNTKKMKIRRIGLVKLAFFTLLSTILAGEQAGVCAFDPKAYDAEAGKTATCDAVKRTVTLSRTAAGDISDSKDALVVEREDTGPIQLCT